MQTNKKIAYMPTSFLEFKNPLKNSDCMITTTTCKQAGDEKRASEIISIIIISFVSMKRNNNDNCHTLFCNK